MRFGKSDLDWAVDTGLIDREAAERLWSALAARDAERPRFDAAHVAAYAGALLVIGAMAWFMTAAWEELGGAGIFAIAAVYMAGFGGFGWRQWRRPGGRLVGGLLVTIAVAITPLATYGLLRWTGLWWGGDPGSHTDFHYWIRSGWFTLEAATIAVGLAALRFVRFPFVTAPVAFALWYMSMDLTPILFGDDFEWTARKLVSLWFGLAMIAAAYVVDRRTREDFAFWGYLFGLSAFWGGLTLMDSDSEVAKFGYFLVNLALILAAVFLRRRTFVVFGGFGAFGYLGHLASDLFADSFLFPFVLTGFGVAVIAFGVALRLHGAAWSAELIDALPSGLRRLRPVERR
ncbi:MAG: DUF2157 domain-containing protein [Rhodospirillaceae bacterium]